MKAALTIKQQRVFQILKKNALRNKRSPTLSELGSQLGFKSLRTVVQYLDILERKGYIVRRKHISRNIELLNTDSEGLPNQTISIPVVASVGCDDLSIFANEDHDEYLEVDKEMVKNPKEIVAVRAVGDSMTDAGIHSGDYILIQFTDHFESGDRVAAIVNDMVVVKRFERRDGHVILRPESKDPRYTPIVLSESFKITGKVLCVIPNPTAEVTEVVPL